MNTMMTVNKQTKRLVGFAAVAATLFTLGGTLTLADHYVRSSTDASISIAANPAARQAAVTVRGQAVRS